MHFAKKTMPYAEPIADNDAGLLAYAEPWMVKT